MFSLRFMSVAAAILAVVEGGILPPVPEVRNGSGLPIHAPIPPGRMPDATAGKGVCLAWGAQPPRLHRSAPRRRDRVFGEGAEHGTRGACAPHTKRVRQDACRYAGHIERFRGLRRGFKVNRIWPQLRVATRKSGPSCRSPGRSSRVFKNAQPDEEATLWSIRA